MSASLQRFNNTIDPVCGTIVKSDDYDELEGFDLSALQPHQIAWVIAGVCTVISISLTFVLIYRHFVYYRRPEQQRHIIRILLMVPFYSVSSFLSLRFVHGSVYFDAVRSCYEAFVIYSFYALLLNYLGPDHPTQKAALQKKPDGRYPFPFSCIFYNPRSGGFLKACTRGTLQYALIHPITSFLAVILESLGMLCPENYGGNHPAIYLLTIEMTSVMIAMYYLVFFYVVVQDDIAKYKPIMKFVAVKFVLFFSFWQSVFLSSISSWGWIKESEYFSVSQISSQVQNFMICIEMVIACLMHIKCFSSEDYEGYRTNVSKGFRDVMIPTDLIADTRKAMVLKKKVKQNPGVELASISKTANAAGGVVSPKSPGPSNIFHPRQASDHYGYEEQSLISKGGFALGGSDMGELMRHDSIDTNPDMAEDEMDEELDGIGIIRLNPKLNSSDDQVDDK